MKNLTTIVGCAVILSASSLALAINASSPAPRAEIVAANAASVEGTIRSIARDKASFVLQVDENKTETISINDKTVYMLDGTSSTRDEALKSGRDATVMHEEKVASRVEVSSENPTD